MGKDKGMSVSGPGKKALVITGRGDTRSINDIGTHLPPKEFAEVMRAIDDKRVTWDEKKTDFSTVLDSSLCRGEFVYKGVRYAYTESYERPRSLDRKSWYRKRRR